MTKVCPEHRSVMRKGYCLPCKAAKEKVRYASNPEHHRRRKRDEYHHKHKQPNGEGMADTCEHDGALAVDESDIHPTRSTEETIAFFCLECGDFINESGEVIEDPTKPKAGGKKAGKALSPLPPVARAIYSRDKSTMVEVECSHPGCKKTFLLYPQNIREQNWCPPIHRPLKKLEQARDRQKAFRQRHQQPGAK